MLTCFKNDDEGNTTYNHGVCLPVWDDVIRERASDVIKEPRAAVRPRSEARVSGRPG